VQLRPGRRRLRASSGCWRREQRREQLQIAEQILIPVYHFFALQGEKMIDKNEKCHAAAGETAFCVSPGHGRWRRCAQYDEDLWQYEVGWCRTNNQTINYMKVSIVAKERIAMLKCRCSDPHIVGRDGAALLS
jgi:hypothetical protein